MSDVPENMRQRRRRKGSPEVEEPKPRGRPPLPEGQGRKPRRVYFSDVEWEAVRIAARNGGRRVSHFVRMCALGMKYAGTKKEAEKLSTMFGTAFRSPRHEPWPGDLFLRDAERDYGPGKWLHVEDVRYWPKLLITVRHLDRWGTVLVVEGDAWEAYIEPYEAKWANPVRPPPR